MLIDFLSVEMGDKTVHDLIEALKAINRHDVVRIITEVYPGMFKQCPFLIFLCWNKNIVNTALKITGDYMNVLV